MIYAAFTFVTMFFVSMLLAGFGLVVCGVNSENTSEERAAVAMVVIPAIIAALSTLFVWFGRML